MVLGGPERLPNTKKADGLSEASFAGLMNTCGTKYAPPTDGAAQKKRIRDLRNAPKGLTSKFC